MISSVHVAALKHRSKGFCVLINGSPCFDNLANHPDQRRNQGKILQRILGGGGEEELCPTRDVPNGVLYVLRQWAYKSLLEISRWRGGCLFQPQKIAGRSRGKDSSVDLPKTVSSLFQTRLLWG